MKRKKMVVVVLAIALSLALAPYRHKQAYKTAQPEKQETTSASNNDALPAIDLLPARAIFYFVMN